MKTPIIPAPKTLQPATRRWFEQVQADFCLEPHHVRLLELAGMAWDRAQAASAALKAHGLTQTDRWGFVKPRPENSIATASMITHCRIMREIGLGDSEEPSTARPPVIAMAGRRTL
jgi:phage terminase small subunit